MRKALFALGLCGFFALAAPAFAADGTISGTVTHASDATAVSTLYVSATNTSTGAVTTYAWTAADGTYSLTVAPGTYDVAPSTTTSVETGVIFLKTSTTVTVASGVAVTGKNFSLTRRAKFTGHVYTSDGVTPVADATVTMVSASGYANGNGYTTSLSNGLYTATPATTDTTLSAIGGFTFTVSKAGYFAVSESDVIIGANESSTTKDVTLLPASSVSGTVTDANGVAVASATVTVTKSTGYSSYSAQTNASGAYTASIYETVANSTAVGDYTITVSKIGYVTTTGATAIGADGTTITGENFTLVASGTIIGTALSDGVALASATVTADDGFGSSYTTTTGTDGTYTLSSLRASMKYTVTISKTNYVTQKLYNVTVTAGATTSGKNATLSAAKAFSGTVKTTSDVVIEGAVVTLYKRNAARSSSADYTYTTKSDGSFSFTNVAPGKYRVKIVKTGYISSVIETINLTASVSGTTYKLALAGSIFGRVTAKNVPVGGTLIYVYALKNGKTVSLSLVITDENGYYRVAGLVKGTYKLYVWSTEYITNVVDVAVKVGIQKTANVALKRGGSITGFITDKTTGLPISATVKVVGTNVSTNADSNGYYVLDGIAPGARKIVVMNQYYEIPARPTVTIVAGATVSGVNFALDQK